MPQFDNQTFIAVAQFLLEDIQTSQADMTTQASLRTIAGRCYYAAYGFMRTRIILECGSNCFGAFGLHSELAKVCSESNEDHLSRIGAKFNRLLALRLRADYNTDQAQDVSVDEAAGAIDAARKTCEKIATLQIQHLREVFLKCDNARSEMQQRRRYS